MQALGFTSYSFYQNLPKLPIKRVSNRLNVSESGESSQPTQSLPLFDSLEHENNCENFLPKIHFNLVGPKHQSFATQGDRAIHMLQNQGCLSFYGINECIF